MANSNSRILYLVGRYPELSETFIQREIDGLRKRGLCIQVMGTIGHPWTLSPAGAIRLGTAPIAVYRELQQTTPGVGQKTIAHALARAIAVASRAAGTTHIHAHFLGFPSLVAFCVSRLLSIPYSLSAHAHDIYVVSTPEEIVRAATFRTTCTQRNMDYLNRLYPCAPFELVRHGMSIENVKRVDTVQGQGQCRILGVGRLVEKKGFVHLVRACQILKERAESFSCNIVGSGPLLPELKREIAALDLLEDINLLGALPQHRVQEEYRQADVLVVPSVIASNGDRDGLPNVILEAMSSGLPVIATDAGSIPEAVRDGGTGLLVPQKNAGAIADQIQRLNAHPKLRESLIDASYNLIESQYRASVWLEKLHALFLASA